MTTTHELEHARDGISSGSTSFEKGWDAMRGGDAPSKQGTKDTLGGTAHSGAAAVMGEKTDKEKDEAKGAVKDIINAGQERWLKDQRRGTLCKDHSEIAAVCK